LAGSLHCALETRLQPFGQFFNDFLYEIFNKFRSKSRIFAIKTRIDFLSDFLMIYKIPVYKVKVLRGGVKTRWLGWQFVM